MKQKDIILVVAVVIVSGTISFFLSKYLFTIPKDRQTKVEVVQAISSDFPQPDGRYFNANAIDPTKNITIGDTQNTQPFSTQNGQ
ncbi:MAG: hypothetical protein QG553_634 [Patescibacteria group bacterium]|nr:hypothetical protein [Patescibacteria group bacterium]